MRTPGREAFEAQAEYQEAVNKYEELCKQMEKAYEEVTKALNTAGSLYTNLDKEGMAEYLELLAGWKEANYK